MRLAFHARPLVNVSLRSSSLRRLNPMRILHSEREHEDATIREGPRKIAPDQGIQNAMNSPQFVRSLGFNTTYLKLQEYCQACAVSGYLLMLERAWTRRSIRVRLITSSQCRAPAARILSPRASSCRTCWLGGEEQGDEDTH
ncbi:hypothetical protein MLD38_020867 [Melastoma candidum]|uniref:Uncharacterized protein n=1 Tax=Melastoma candidum TaxID=119954 RepID=A0ACB9QG75_9MYRT|nr:hypothetical protein MLD38_020867 [Melastoma candidum]